MTWAELAKLPVPYWANGTEYTLRQWEILSWADKTNGLVIDRGALERMPWGQLYALHLYVMLGPTKLKEEYHPWH